VAYRELAPPPAVASHVACLWRRDDAPQVVLPDGCVDVVWTGAQVLVAGPSTRPFAPSVRSGETKLGVRFRVGAAAVALGVGADELLDSSPALGDVWGDRDELTERVAGAAGPGERLALLVGAVAARLETAPPPDPLIRRAILDLSRPRPRIGGISERLAISERQLRRRFEAAVGYSPRTLARVLRLQRFLALARSDGGDLARLAVDAGYADQPHLTRDCAALGGLPAAALVASGAGPAGERQLSLIPPSAVSVHDGLWAISQGWPSGSMTIAL
jgi:AraC-like DNA-binding protein